VILTKNQELLTKIVQALFFAALIVVVAATVAPAPVYPFVWTIHDKILHFVAYFGLGLIGGIGWPERRSALLVSMPLFGMALECIQGLMIVGRSFDWLDGLANAIGLFVGVVSSFPARRIIFALP